MHSLQLAQCARMMQPGILLRNATLAEIVLSATLARQQAAHRARVLQRVIMPGAAGCQTLLLDIFANQRQAVAAAPPQPYNLLAVAGTLRHGMAGL